ncbi:MAG: ABC transporter ATP-binding protein [Bacteroidia bacterium]|nr:ABC transporter ATP-binding protein [Bacteroidia bacterium]
MDKPLISVKNLTKSYQMGDTIVHALRGVSIDIYKDDFVAITGASGSGKSTFMNTLGCLDKPTSGEYYLDGVDALNMDKNQLAEFRNRKIGFIFQSFNILARTSALENVELPLLYNNKISTKERKARALEALASVGLADRANNMPNQLSGGQQQRVAIARALVNAPLVIMADEPTGNLDTRTSLEIMSIFQNLNSTGITIVMVTHEPDIARCAMMNIVFRDGRIIGSREVPNRLIAAEELKKMPVESAESTI